MSHFYFMNLQDCPSNRDEDTIGNDNADNIICICCLRKDQNNEFFDVQKCSHASLLNYCLGFQLEEKCKICEQCHDFLKKVDQFKTQVQESHRTLTNQLHQIPTPSNQIWNLTLYCSDADTKTKEADKLESGNHTVENELDIEYNIKSEENSCGFDETENSVTEGTSLKEEVTDGLANEGRNENPEAEDPLPLQTKNKTLPAAPKWQRDLRYYGKINIVRITEEDMQKERSEMIEQEIYKKYKFRCEHCILSFLYEHRLDAHNKRHHCESLGSHLCKICKCRQSTESSHKTHVLRHYTRYECALCSVRYRSLHNAVKHYNDNHEQIANELYKCQLCDFTTELIRSFRYHMEKHQGRKECKYCGKSFINQSGLNMHVVEVHTNTDRTFPCPHCDKEFKTRSALWSHTASQHRNQERAYCSLCRRYFNTETIYRSHLKYSKAHWDESTKKYECDYCHKLFPNRSYIATHISWAHLQMSKLKCSVCDKLFKNKSSLRRHVDFVHEKKRAPRNQICDYCGKGFTTSQILATHIRTHTGERPLQCSHCDANFAHPAALYTHNKLLHQNNIK